MTRTCPPLAADVPTGVHPLKTLLLYPLLLTLMVALTSPALAVPSNDAPLPSNDLPEMQGEEDEDDGAAEATDEAKAKARNALRKRPAIAPSPTLGAPALRSADDDPSDAPSTPESIEPPMSGPRSNAVAQATKKKDDSPGKSDSEGKDSLKAAGDRKTTKSSPDDTRLHVDYDNAEIKDVVKDFAERWGLNVLIDPKISGKVTIISPVPVLRADAFKIFLAALDQQGYTTVVEGRDARGEPYLLRVINSREAKSEPIQVYRGSTPNTATLITRIIQLENVSVDDVSKVIGKMISSDGDLTTYNPSNTLILTDSGNNIRRILDIIKELDISAPRQKLEVIQIQFAEAARVVEIVREIYGEEASGTKAAAKTKTSSRASRRNNKNKTTAAPKSASNTSVGSEASFIGKMIADERTNSIIVLATEKSLVEIKDLIKNIDYETDPNASDIQVIYLSHAKAEELSQTLNSLIQQSNQRATQTNRTAKRGANSNARDTPAPRGGTAGAAGSLGNFSGEVRITHDVPTNSLVVTASPEDFRRLNRVIDALDIARKQVFVETVIMEVSDTERKDTGVSWHGGRPGDTSNPAAVNVVAGRGTESLNLASALLDGSLLGGAGLGIFGNAIDLALPGVEGGISIPTFGIVLRALQDDSSTNVLSAPNILTLDNEEATIEVGETVPFPTGGFLGGLAGAAGASGLGGIPSVSFTREDVGIILRLTPQVNESDWVTLDVYQEISEVKEGSASDSGGGPTTTKRSAETHVSVRSNQTIVIGGLMQEVETETETKVPILGDIPLIGALFRNKLKTKRKTNLLIFLTPHVIDGAEDLQEVYRIKMLQREEFMRRFYGKTREEQAKELSALLRYSMNLPEQPSVYRDRVPTPKVVNLTTPESQVNEDLVDMLDAAGDDEVLITPDGEYVPADETEFEDLETEEDEGGAVEEEGASPGAPSTSEGGE